MSRTAADLEGASLGEARAIEVAPGVSIPLEEIRVRATRSGGPGGQHVNKVATQAVAEFDVASSRALDEAARMRILDHLRTRINREGVLQVRSSRHRTFHANRRAALERLERLLVEAFEDAKPRTPTRPHRAAKEARIREKKRRSEIKRLRAIQPDPENE